MPAAITHYYQAKRVLEKCRITDYNSDAFFWGAQGPDFFFCHRYLPWQKGVSLSEYGDKLHRENPSKLLATIRQYYKENPDPNVLSYIYGFLCHYCADRTCHPLIRVQSKKLLEKNSKQSENIFHNYVESQLDIILLRYETGKFPTEFSLKQTVPKNSCVQNSIAGLYAYLLKKLYGKFVSKDLILQAEHDMQIGFGFLTDRTSLKRFLLYRLENMCGGRHIYSCHFRGISEEDEFDYANVLLEPWSSPLDGLIHHESFLDLYENSIVDAEKMIQRFLTVSDFTELTKDITF